MDDAELRPHLERHHTESFGWALACCSYDRDEAESVLQTVYLKILEGRARFAGRASVRTWLFSVIRLTACDERRRSALHRLWWGTNERLVPMRDHGESADEAVYHFQLRGLFREALLGLPRRQREVLQLVFYHDLSVHDAAGVMGVSVGSARTHYERGKKRLGRWLEQRGVHDGSRPTAAENTLR